MRTIKYIVLHCTATSQIATVQSILNYWSKIKKWKTPGYHFLIEPNGEFHDLVPIEKPSNAAKGYNQESIHISYIGGVDFENKPIDNRTPEQKGTQLELIRILKNKYPEAEILGHRDLPGVNKACPSFDVKSWFSRYRLNDSLKQKLT
jgi:N-acetylmuramoyl-L-alanine amidase